MSFGSKKSPTYDKSQATVKFDPLQYQESDDYKKTLSKIGEMVNQDSIAPIFNLGSNYATNVLGEGYQAFTPEQQQKMIDDQTKQAQKGFEETRGAIGSRLANQGLAGSGVAGMDWGGTAANENKAIADIVSNVGNQNIAATRQDKAQAFGALPGLASMSQIPLQNQMAYSGMLGQDQATRNAWNQWNVNRGDQAQLANIGQYMDWFKQKSQEANNNQNAFGQMLGNLNPFNK
jgi:hypothetical protein